MTRGSRDLPFAVRGDFVPRGTVKRLREQPIEGRHVGAQNEYGSRPAAEDLASVALRGHWIEGRHVGAQGEYGSRPAAEDLASVALRGAWIVVGALGHNDGGELAAIA